MSFNLLKTVQQNLGYPELKKVDPNTQEADFDNSTAVTNKLGQAAIPTVLTGLYRYSETDEGSTEIISGNSSMDWIKSIFGDVAGLITTKIASYSNCPADTVYSKMQEIANESVKVIRGHLKTPGNTLSIKNFMLTQRNNILPYLPATLQLGKLLKDNTLDDRTNKMKGPVSNFMHGIESIMSGSDKPEKSDNF